LTLIPVEKPVLPVPLTTVENPGGGGGLAIRMSEISKNSKTSFFFLYFELSLPL
jgi:hypothetical protein